MDGLGSRLGRASSRYGPSATATAFSGPVRKWKRKWVHVSPSPTLNYHSSNNNSPFNGHSDKNNGSRLLLCRWTPLSPSAASSTTTEDLPPKRKFRYTPIVVLEERSKSEKTAGQEVEDQLVGWQTAKDYDHSIDVGFNTETQGSNTSHLDLDLCLKGHDPNVDCVGQSKEDQVKQAGSGEFWKLGRLHESETN